MSPRYDLTVRSEEPIPEDVLVEHVAVALRDFKFTGKVDVQVARQHPFDGPEVFDDYFAPKPPTTGTASEGSFAVIDPYPNVTEAAMQLREDRDRGGA
jgi:hypothetical protein